MAKVALYRKYRPQNFDELFGQDHIRRILKNAIEDASFSHAYIFSGPRGVGKTSVARILAKAINCKNPKEGNPCNICEFCVSATDQNALDIIEIDAASNRGIDEIRDLREKVKFGPSELMYKVFIIDEVHMLTREASNALLKTLEEPPEHAVFVLATTEIHKIPATVISRCQRFDFKRIDLASLNSRLKEICGKEKIKIDDDAITEISKASDGGLRDAISILDQLSGSTSKDLTQKNVAEALGLVGDHKIEDIYSHIAKGDKKAAIEKVSEIFEQGGDIGNLTKGLMEKYRLSMHQSFDDPAKLDEYSKAIEVLSESYANFKNSLYPQLSVEIAILKIINMNSSPKEERVIEVRQPEVGAATPKSETQKTSSSSNLQDSWSRVLFEVKEKNMSIHAFLKASEPKFGEEEIHLFFLYKFHKQKIDEKKNLEVIDNAVKKIYGKSFIIKTFLNNSRVQAQDIREKSSTRENKKEVYKSVQDTSIDEYLNILGGEEIK